MKIGVFSHCTIDTIVIGESVYEQIGGAACYCSLTARVFKFDVELYTKFGKDFSSEYLSKNKIKFENALSDKSTTRFTLRISGPNRTLSLGTMCAPLNYVNTNVDGLIISPVFNEISLEMFEKLKQDSNFIFLDPQGFLRRTDSNKNIFLKKTEINLSKISAIKSSPNELFNLTGNTGVDGMKSLQKRGIKYVILTNKRDISVLEKDKIYSITLPNIELNDTTGIGDVFSAAFCCTMLKEKDFFWALCFAGGAAQAALESKKIGLDKIPKKGAVETNAAYFYNQIKFKQV